MTEDRFLPAVPIGEALRQVLRRSGSHVNVTAQQVILEWDSAVGPHVGRAAKPVKIVKGVLTIRASSAVWRTELLMRKTELAAKINAYFQAELVKTIIIT